MKILAWSDSSKVLYESQNETMKETIIEAIASDADLSDANLHGANLSDADLIGADFYRTYFYGRNGSTKIKKSQVEEFHAALGIIVEE